MIFREVDSNMDLYVEEKISPISLKRDGLTIVEWGGTELSIKKELSPLAYLNLKAEDFIIPEVCRCHTMNELLVLY
jgi:hypothetical protein